MNNETTNQVIGNIINCLHIVDFNVELNASFEMSNLGLLHHYLGI